MSKKYLTSAQWEVLDFLDRVGKQPSVAMNTNTVTALKRRGFVSIDENFVVKLTESGSKKLFESKQSPKNSNQ